MGAAPFSQARPQAINQTRANPRARLNAHDLHAIRRACLPACPSRHSDRHIAAASLASDPAVPHLSAHYGRCAAVNNGSPCAYRGNREVPENPRRPIHCASQVPFTRPSAFAQSAPQENQSAPVPWVKHACGSDRWHRSPIRWNETQASVRPVCRPQGRPR
jgi:hypothetical protein